MNPKYQPLLDEWTQGLEREEALLTIVNQVRDIPFQFIDTRDIDSMLEAGVGTCNAKHMLLKELAEGLRYQVRFLVDKFNLSDFLKELDPEHSKVIQLKEIAAKMDPYYHTYIQIFNNEKWVAVDITFDSALEPYGFVVASDWDGKTNTDLPHTPMEQYVIEEEPGQFKKNLLKGESEENKQYRKEFFALLNDYLNELRNKNL